MVLAQWLRTRNPQPSISVFIPLFVYEDNTALGIKEPVIQAAFYVLGFLDGFFVILFGSIWLLLFKAM